MELLHCTVHYIEEYCVFIVKKNKDEVEEKENKFGDLDQLLRIERMKEQKTKKDETLEPEVDETQVSRLIYKPSHGYPVGTL